MAEVEMVLARFQAWAEKEPVRGCSEAQFLVATGEAIPVSPSMAGKVARLADAVGGELMVLAGCGLDWAVWEHVECPLRDIRCGEAHHDPWFARL